ncbi:hypothetical protein GGF32_008366 [Allomyces javanicus]|nr:hypothetical protein GGF32_008366 [Allomyces javanicus]
MAAEILLGPIEFAMWQTLTRAGAVALIVRLVYLTVFVRRPGFLLAVALDPWAALASLLRFATTRLSTRGLLQLLLATGLFFLALVGVIVNAGMSTAFSAYQQVRQVRLVWLRPTNATARTAVPMAQYGEPVPRQAANAILQALIKDKVLNETTWVRTVGTLTEAEVMSMRFDDQCVGNPGGEASLHAAGLEPAVIRGTGLETRLLALDWADSAGRSSMILPIPVVRILESAGRLDSATPATAALQQYGVTTTGTFIGGYQVECGLSPADVDQWIKDRTVASPSFSVAPDLDPSMGPTKPPARTPPSRASTLQYLDYAQVSSIGQKGQDSKSGTVTAVLASLDPARTAKGEFEYLTFGALTSTTKGGLKVTSLLSVSDALVASGKLTAKKLTTQMALSSIVQTCTPSRVSVGSFVVNKTIDLAKEESSAGFTVASSNRPFAWAARPSAAALPYCRLELKGLGSTRMLDGNVTQTPAEEMQGHSMQYLNGAQVCRTVVRNFKIPAGFDSLGSPVAAQRSDFIVAVQIAQHDVQYRPRPKLTMGLLPRWFGPDTVADNGFSDSHGGWVEIRLDAANSGGLVADGSSLYPSWTDPDGPQQYFMNAVGVGVWEVIASLVLMLTPIVLAFAQLPMLFDTVVTQLFLYPVLRHTHERTHNQDLTFRATLALVEYPAGMDPAAAMAAPPNARPPAAFDVQFIHASQR